MKDGELLVVKTHPIDGRNWTNSGFCLGVYYRGHIFSDNALEEPTSDVNWCIDDYVEEYLRSGYVARIDAEIQTSLDNEVYSLRQRSN